jgi:integrase
MARNGSRRGLGRIYQRGGYWWVDIQYGKVRIRKSARTKNRDEAVALYDRLRDELRAGRFAEAAAAADKITTFDDLVELLRRDYERRGLRSWDRAQRAITHLRSAFGNTPAAAISFAHVETYIEDRQAEGAKPGTIHAEAAILRRMLRLGVAKKLLRSLPVFPTLETSPARQGYLTEEQVAAVVARLKQPVADLVHALWITGWRRREVQFLKWSDVDMEAGEIRLIEERSKTREPRLFPFGSSPSLAAIVRTRHDRRTEQTVYVFERSPGQPVKDFRTAWANACKGAGVPGRVCHDLRRSRARALSRAGVPQSVAMRLLGHKTPSMFLRYDVAATDDLANAVAAVESAGNGTPAVQTRTGGAAAPNGSTK